MIFNRQVDLQLHVPFQIISTRHQAVDVRVQAVCADIDLNQCKHLLGSISWTRAQHSKTLKTLSYGMNVCQVHEQHLTPWIILYGAKTNHKYISTSLLSVNTNMVEVSFSRLGLTHFINFSKKVKITKLRYQKLVQPY